MHFVNIISLIWTLRRWLGILVAWLTIHYPKWEPIRNSCFDNCFQKHSKNRYSPSSLWIQFSLRLHSHGSRGGSVVIEKLLVALIRWWNDFWMTWILLGKIYELGANHQISDLVRQMFIDYPSLVNEIFPSSKFCISYKLSVTNDTRNSLLWRRFSMVNSTHFVANFSLSVCQYSEFWKWSHHSIRMDVRFDDTRSV